MRRNAWDVYVVQGRCCEDVNAGAPSRSSSVMRVSALLRIASDPVSRSRILSLVTSTTTLVAKRAARSFKCLVVAVEIWVPERDEIFEVCIMFESKMIRFHMIVLDVLKGKACAPPGGSFGGARLPPTARTTDTVDA